MSVKVRKYVMIVEETQQETDDVLAGRVWRADFDSRYGFVSAKKHLDKMAELPPSTSEEIARHSQLNERYVREWLGAMVTGKVVDYDAANRK